MKKLMRKCKGCITGCILLVICSSLIFCFAIEFDHKRLVNIIRISWTKGNSYMQENLNKYLHELFNKASCIVALKFKGWLSVFPFPNVTSKNRIMFFKHPSTERNAETGKQCALL